MRMMGLMGYAELTFGLPDLSVDNFEIYIAFGCFGHLFLALEKAMKPTVFHGKLQPQANPSTGSTGR